MVINFFLSSNICKFSPIFNFQIEEKCRFLSNFSRQTAEVELPGELLLPKHSHYHVCIQRFMPKVEIVQKHNSAARRLYIRGHNGKIYPYLVVSDSGLADARREERLLQLLRHQQIAWCLRCRRRNPLSETSQILPRIFDNCPSR